MVNKSQIASPNNVNKGLDKFTVIMQGNNGLDFTDDASFATQRNNTDSWWSTEEN